MLMGVALMRIDLLCCRLLPVRGVRNSDGGLRGHERRDQHGFIAGQNRLAPRHLALALVDSLDSTGSLHTVGLVGEGLLDGSVLVAVQTPVHRGRIRVLGIRIPLGHDHTRFASDGAVVAGLALLIGAHGPSCIFLIRRHGHEVGVVGGKGAGSALNEGARLEWRVAMAVSSTRSLVNLV